MGSVLTRAARPPDLTVRYGGHPDQVADIWRPAFPISQTDDGPPTGDGPRAGGGVMFFHGGFWRAEWDRAHVAPLAADLAARGRAVITVEYRRTGAEGGGWPGTFDDVAAAVRTLPGLVATATGRPPERWVLAGHSAGGQLALWAASTLDPAARAGVLAVAPVADLRRAYELDLDQGAVAALLGGGPSEWPERFAAVDPMGLVPLGTAVAVVHGTEDRHVPVEFSRDFAAAAGRAGDEVHLAVLEGVEHFSPIDPESAAWPAVLSALSAVDGGRRRDNRR